MLIADRPLRANLAGLDTNVIGCQRGSFRGFKWHRQSRVPPSINLSRYLSLVVETVRR